MVWYSGRCCTSKSRERIPDLRIWSRTAVCLPYSCHIVTWLDGVTEWRFSMLLFFSQHTQDTRLWEHSGICIIPHVLTLTWPFSTQENKERSEKAIIRRKSYIFHLFWIVYIFFFAKFRILEEASDTTHNSLGHTCVMCSSSESRKLTIAGLRPQGAHSWVGMQTWSAG